MLQERVEEVACRFPPRLRAEWIGQGTRIAVISETQSRSVLAHLCELAAYDLGAESFHIQMPTPAQTAPVPVKSTGTSAAIAKLVRWRGAEAGRGDRRLHGRGADPCAGMAGDRGSGGARVRASPTNTRRSWSGPSRRPRTTPSCRSASRCWREARARMWSRRLPKSTDGRLARRALRRHGGVRHQAGRGGKALAGGLCLAFPGKAVNGRVVMDVGDMNLTFKTFLTSRIDLTRRERLRHRDQGRRHRRLATCANTWKPGTTATPMG